MIDRPGRAAQIPKQLGPTAQPHIAELARRCTPLHRYIFRNTRALLREYRKRGIVKDRS